MTHLTAEQNERIRAVLRPMIAESSQFDVAKRLGVSHVMLSVFMNPARTKGASYETAKRVAKLVGVSVNELLGTATGSDSEVLLEIRDLLREILSELRADKHPARSRAAILRVATAKQNTTRR